MNMRLCIYWEWKGVFFYKLLLKNQIIERYCSHLCQLKAVINEKASGMSLEKGCNQEVRYMSFVCVRERSDKK